MNKKITTILIIIAVALLLFGLVYFYFYYMTPEEGGGANFPNANVPSGTGGETGISPWETEDFTSPVNVGKEGITLRQITKDPVAGGIIFDKNGAVTVRYVDRGKGFIYETPAEEEGVFRISNKTIPKIEQALWGEKGNEVILRYLKDDETIVSFAGNLKGGTASGTEMSLDGIFLPSNIKEMAMSPSSGKIFYLSNSGAGSQNSTGITAGIDGARKLQIFDSPVHEWLVSWPEENVLALSTKPSLSVPGLLYFLNAKTGRMSKILGGIPGLTALASPSLSHVLYSESSKNSLALKVFDIKEAKSREAIVKTLPEKCVWSKKDSEIAYCGVPDVILDGNYPDSWYQGFVSFSDNIWKVKAVSGLATVVADLPGYGADIDLINPILSPDEDYLLFQNKKDLTLWILKIK